MFNLLPLDKKRIILKEYRIRLLIIFLIMLFVTGIIFSVFLLPSYFMISIKYSDVSSDLQRLQEEIPESLELEKLESNILRVNNKLNILNPAETAFPSRIIEKVIGNLPAGTVVRNFSYDLKEGSIKLEISGVATNRDSLTALVINLENEEDFSAVNLPVSNLATGRNIDFSITFDANLN